jgi:DNA-binding GntR family transcriptional regulator
MSPDSDAVIKFSDPGLIRSRVVDALRAAIVEGRLKPGQRIRERELVVSLGISRSPLREAIRVLEAEGLITAAPHRGARVSDLSVDDLRATADVRIMLETYAARLACERLDDQALTAMTVQIDRAGKGERGRKVATELNYSMGFHDVFVGACGNQKLIQLYQIVKRHLRRYQLLAFARLNRAQRATDEHAKILSAFRKRDGAAVERLLREHLSRAADEIIMHLKTSVDGGEAARSSATSQPPGRRP